MIEVRCEMAVCFYGVGDPERCLTTDNNNISSIVGNHVNSFSIVSLNGL
jgi:hypothetical protein